MVIKSFLLMLVFFTLISCASIRISSGGIALGIFGLEDEFFSLELINEIPVDVRHDIDNELEKLAKDIVESLKKENDVKVVAVLSFNNLDTKKESYLGRYTSEYMTDYISKNLKKTKMVERSQIVRIGEEWQRSQSGEVNEASAVSIGKLTGANTVVFGTLSKIGDTIKTTARAADAETGEIIRSVSGRISGSEAVNMYEKF